jgi:hypothetical protein
MKHGWFVGSLIALLALSQWTGSAAAQHVASRDMAPSIAASQMDAEQFTFVLFWKVDNPAKQRMSSGLREALAQRSDSAALTEINAADYANRATIERFGVERAPMPLVLCIAPNGAITGAYTKPLSVEEVERAIVTPAMTRCLKAIQDKKIAVVHVKPDIDSPLPAGASGFASDPSFKERTEIISLVAHDPEERRFMTDMELDPVTTNESVIIVMAPPGALVGKFPAAATKEQIAAELHAAGKCCDDPNCNHNKKGN